MNSCVATGQAASRNTVNLDFFHEHFDFTLNFIDEKSGLKATLKQTPKKETATDTSLCYLRQIISLPGGQPKPVWPAIV